MNQEDLQRLSQYLDGEVSVHERSELEKLIETDEEWGEEYARLKETHKVLAELYPRKKLKRPSVKARRRSRRAPMMMAAAAILLAVIATLAVLEMNRQGESAPDQRLATSTSTDETPGGDTPPENEAAPGSGLTVATPAQPSTPATARRTTMAGGILQGYARDVDGQGIPGVEVVLTGSAMNSRGRYETSAVARARTDADGAFSMKQAAAASSLWFEKEGFTPMGMALTQTVNNRTMTIDTVLLPSGKITGRVTDSSGAPLENVRVMGNQEIGKQQSITDGEGRFTIPSYHRGLGENLYFHHRDYAVGRVENATESQPVEIALAKGGTIRAVARRGRNLLEGVIIEARVSNYNLPDPWVARTDADGQAMLRHMPETDAYNITARMPDGETVTYSSEGVDVKEGTVAEALFIFPAERGGTIQGTVRLANGEAAARAQVYLSSEALPWRRLTETDDNGEYSMSAPPGNYQMNASYEGRAGIVYRVTDNVGPLTIERSGAETTRNFNLSPVPPSRLTVVDENGDPVQRFQVAAANFTESVASVTVDTPDGILMSPRGRYTRFVIDPERNIGGFAMIEEDNRQNLKVILDKPLIAMEGYVTDELGDPLPGAMVMARSTSGGYHDSYALSDSSGIVTLPRLVEGFNYILTAWLSGYQGIGSHGNFTSPDRPFKADGSALPTMVLRRQTATIEGTVTYLDGNAVVGAEIFASGRNDERLRGIRTDLTGRFIVAVAPGNYDVHADPGPGLESSREAVRAPAKSVNIVVASLTPDVEPPSGADVEAAENMLKQMGLVFKMFANESRGEKWPTLSRQYGQFMPERTAVYPEYLTDDGMVARMAGRHTVKWAYFGYAISDEATALSFLDSYEEFGPDGIYDQDLKLEDAQDLGPGGNIYRLREGIERFMITDINNPAASSQATSSLPVLWEIPTSRTENGGYVLYMDGHVEWQPYPGPYPMTRAVTDRITQIMADGESRQPE
jgi:protocatechuate 3,4-dioxygenase beta subunit